MLGVNTAENVVNGFPELWNIIRDPGEHQDVPCAVVGITPGFLQRNFGGRGGNTHPV